MNLQYLADFILHTFIYMTIHTQVCAYRHKIQWLVRVLQINFELVSLVSSIIVYICSSFGFSLIISPNSLPKKGAMANETKNRNEDRPLYAHPNRIFLT